jgi:hypothetical protein
MPQLTLDVTMSLDGFVAGPNPSYVVHLTFARAS